MDLDEKLASLYPAAFRHAWALTGSRADAEDLVQDSLVRLISRARRGEIDIPSAYLRTIVTNEFLRSGRRRTPSPVAPVGPDAEIGVTPSESTAVDQRLEAAALLAVLPPRERAAVVARHYLDLSVQDVAAVMGVSYGTAKATLSHALARLERHRAQAGTAPGRRIARVRDRD